ncbi:MAG TPA: hypothetical protein VLC09_03390 [Polyangiaceae bacterium]|nr:hypothetical protein [Polyangiaceae bacterium]
MHHSMISALSSRWGAGDEAADELLAPYWGTLTSEAERAHLRAFEAELPEVRRRLRASSQPASAEEIGLALLAVWALTAPRSEPNRREPKRGDQS